MIEPWIILATAAAGGAGAVLRFAITAAGARLAPNFPWGVLAVNVLGSALGGALIAVIPATDAWGDAGRLVLLTGFCGGLTTFSTFAVDIVQLAERDEKLRAANLNAIVNLGLGVGAAAAAYAIAALVVG